MARSKLKGALDRQKGRDVQLEKQRKQEKGARRRKGKRKQDRNESEEEDGEEGGLSIIEGSHSKTNGKMKKDTKRNGVKKIAEEEEWETEESDEDDEDDMPERAVFDMSRLEDSDSEASSDDEAEEEEEAEPSAEEAKEDDDDIPLSDIESLASEDKDDVIPHQRLTINNTTALLAALNRISLPYSKMPFSEHQSIITDEPVEIPDVEDDLNRELSFYKQSLSAVKDARAKLKKEGVSFSRPVDYFAEMVKSDEHMGKIKQKLIDEAAGKKAAAEARKQRDLKKYGKQVQQAKLQERAKDKRQTLEKISLLKRKRSGASLANTNEEDLFDVELDNAAKTSDRRRGDEKPNAKRQKKNAKFGFGGKKRHAKSGDAISSADMSGYSMKKMREGKLGKKGGGASKRLGKSRRAKRV